MFTGSERPWLSWAAPQIRLDDTWIDYVIVAAYVVFVLGIGVALRQRMRTSQEARCAGGRGAGPGGGARHRLIGTVVLFLGLVLGRTGLFGPERPAERRAGFDVNLRWAW